MSRREFLGDRGYLTYALGEKYVELAYLQALSIKSTQKNDKYAIIVDRANESLARQYEHVFDKIIAINYTPMDWDMTQHHWALRLTPWRETIMLDADIVFTSSVDHWWPTLRLRDVCLTNQVFDFRGNRITSRRHRKLFDENMLPDVYAGVMYFRYSQFATEFFLLLRLIADSWDWIADEHLVKNDDKRLRIDESVALAARIVGVQNVTLSAPIPTFVHAKSGLWGLSEQQPWYEQLYTECENGLIVGHHIQRLPFHYHHKEWITDDIIRTYERNHIKLPSSDKRIHP